MFRDLKSGGWKWERSRVWNPDRANRLWLAYAWMASLGAAAFSLDKAVKEVAGGRSRAERCSGWALTCSTSAWNGGASSSVRCCSQAV